MNKLFDEKENLIQLLGNVGCRADDIAVIQNLSEKMTFALPNASCGVIALNCLKIFTKARRR